jgi:hypothetical protein
MPSIHREPSPRSALSSARLWPCLDGRLCRAAESSTSLASLESCDRSRPVPVHASRCRRDRASSGPGMPPDDFCNLIDARAHPTSSRFLAREWSSREPRCSPAPEGAGCVGFHGALPHREPASHDLRATACARRAPLAWTRQIVSQSIRGRWRHWTNVARALLGVFRAPESPARAAASPGVSRVGPRRPRLARDVASRKETSPKRSLGAFHRAETRTRTLVRARTGISSRRLRRGIARRCSRLSCSQRRACF